MKICFVITSVIDFTGKKLSCSDVRSVYNIEDRYNQTIETISSIKKYVPNAEVIIIEAGLKNQMILNFSNEVNKFVFLGNNKICRLCCDSLYKGLGEAMMLLFAFKVNLQHYDYFFKLSGRYKNK